MTEITISIPEELKELALARRINWQLLLSKKLKEEFLKQDEKSKLFREFEELTKESTLSDEDISRMVRKSRKNRFNELKSKGYI